VGPDRHPVAWVGKYQLHPPYHSARWARSDRHHVPCGWLWFPEVKRFSLNHRYPLVLIVHPVLHCASLQILWVILSISSKQVKHHHLEGLSDDGEDFIFNYLEKTVIVQN
jgi:hypothetical protein